MAQFLCGEMRLGLSAEKTLITRPEGGFTGLGYRLVCSEWNRNDNCVGNLRSPKENVLALRREIKKRASRATLVLPFNVLICSLTALISG